VDGGGSLRCALLGDNIAEMAYKNGWSVSALLVVSQWLLVPVPHQIPSDAFFTKSMSYRWVLPASMG